MRTDLRETGWEGGDWFIWLRRGTTGRTLCSCEHSNEPWGSTQGREFLDYL